MTQPIAKHFHYLIKHPNGNAKDKTRLIIHSVSRMDDTRVQAIHEQFMNSVVYSPSRFPKDIVIFDDRPSPTG